MSNEVSTTSNRALAIPGNASPWRQVALEECKAQFAGEILKCRKGKWSKGDSDLAVGETIPFLANMHEIWRGWVRWSDGQPTDQIIGRIIDDFHIPLREQLGDLDESKWQRDAAGNPRDPWARTTYLVMRDARDGELVTFATSSDGGRQAIGRLCDQFDKLMNKHPAKMPVVLLSSESYQHRSFGEIIKPAFNIVDWQCWDAEITADTVSATAAQQRDAMLDEIRF